MLATLPSTALEAFEVDAGGNVDKYERIWHTRVVKLAGVDVPAATHIVSLPGGIPPK